jgi:hypothetical protein
MTSTFVTNVDVTFKFMNSGVSIQTSAISTFRTSDVSNVDISDVGTSKTSTFPNVGIRKLSLFIKSLCLLINNDNFRIPTFGNVDVPTFETFDIRNVDIGDV